MIVWIDDDFGILDNQNSVEQRSLDYIQKKADVGVLIIGSEEKLNDFFISITNGELDPTKLLIICDHNLHFPNHRYGSTAVWWLMRDNRFRDIPVIVYTDDPIKAQREWNRFTREGYIGGDETPLYNKVVPKFNYEDERTPEVILLEAIKEHKPEFLLPNESNEGATRQT